MTPEDDTNQNMGQQAGQAVSTTAQSTVAQPQLTPEQQAWLQQMVALQQRQQQVQQARTDVAGDKGPGHLPAAAIVYGCAASALLVVALSSMISGAWINGILILLPTFILLGYAVHFLKNG